MIRLNDDCLNLIFDQLRTDRNSLHSCLLVNKRWCNVVVPNLWKKHSWDEDLFCDSRHVFGKSERKLFNTILSCLPSSSKELLSDNDIKLPSTILSNPTLFNYISFCEFPNQTIVNKIVIMSLDGRGQINYDKRNLLEQEIYKLFVSRCKNVKQLRWKTLQPLSLFHGASTCFSQLHFLEIDLDFVNSNSLYEMAQICKDLKELFIDKCHQDLPGLIALVEAQMNLKSVTILDKQPKVGTCKELGKVLVKKANTINYLCLGSVNTIPPSSLTSLVNLREISIYSGGDNEDIREEIKEFQQYLAISEFPNLEYLYIDELSCFKELAMLIEKTKGNILDVDIYPFEKETKNTGMLIKAIANNCPMIKRLETYLKPKDFIHLKSLLLNCRYLESIRFDSSDYVVNENNINVGDELLEILTQFSPKSLINIKLSEGWGYSVDAFERLFESCRERTLLYFGITYDYYDFNKNYITEDHKIIVKKYIEEGVIKGSNVELNF